MGESFKVAQRTTKFRIGDIIEWPKNSPAWRSKPKRGPILAIIGPEEDTRDVLVTLRGKDVWPKLRAQAVSLSSRYLVEVEQTGRGGAVNAPAYYAPLVVTIDGESTSAGSLQTQARPLMRRVS